MGNIPGQRGVPHLIEVGTGNLHSCALSADGSAKCWGYAGAGRLGDGPPPPPSTEWHIDRRTPVAVVGLVGATHLSVGLDHSCVLMPDGTVRCWGSNTHGNLGFPGLTWFLTVPTEVPSLSGVTQVAAGYGRTCALVGPSGTVKCLGSGLSGGLGNGEFGDSHVPVDVVGITGASQIATGGNHSCALLADTTVACWGGNDYGQLGDGTRTDSSVPVAVGGLTGVIQVSTGYRHTCALIAGGEVKCWGLDGHGQIAAPPASLYDYVLHPTSIAGITSAVSVTASGSHSCADLADGRIQCWGYNAYGQLGDGTNFERHWPVDVVGIP